MRQRLEKKQQNAIELHHADNFWEDSKVGYCDIHRYEQEKQHEDERWKGNLVLHEVSFNLKFST